MYYIWIKLYENGELVGTSVSAKCYKRKGYAERVARERLSNPRKKNLSYKWIVSETNPWASQDHAN